jgi:hypothetical protein
MNTTMRGFIGEEANSKTSSANDLAMLKRQLATAARLEAVRRSPAMAGGGTLLLEADFKLFTKLPLTQFYKLLPNFL